MFEQPAARFLADGKRLVLQHGPIDLVVQAFGDDTAVHAAYRAAKQRFDGLLAELCQELVLLRSPFDRTRECPSDPWRAAWRQLWRRSRQTYSSRQWPRWPAPSLKKSSAS